MGQIKLDIDFAIVYKEYLEVCALTINELSENIQTIMTNTEEDWKGNGSVALRNYLVQQCQSLNDISTLITELTDESETYQNNMNILEQSGWC